MCQIIKMSYNSGSIVIDVTSSRELSNYIIELLQYDFLKGQYQPYIKQVISSKNISHDSGIYRFKYEISNNCKIKCMISEADRVVTSKERFIGDRINISVKTQRSDIGTLYAMKSNHSISKELIFYKSPASSTKINIPADIIANEPLVFTIKSNMITPKFETYTDFVECFNIEG